MCQIIVLYYFYFSLVFQSCIPLINLYVFSNFSLQNLSPSFKLELHFPSFSNIPFYVLWGKLTCYIPPFSPSELICFGKNICSRISLFSLNQRYFETTWWELSILRTICLPHSSANYHNIKSPNRCRVNITIMLLATGSYGWGGGTNKRR